jgi:hypothetical protein
MANKAGELAGKRMLLCATSFSVSLWLTNHSNNSPQRHREHRERTEKSVQSSSFVHYRFWVAFIPETLPHNYRKFMTGFSLISILASDLRD